MMLNTYLKFDGNCREAFEFYRSVFGGEFSICSTFADGPPEMNVPEAEKDLVMHVSLPVGSSVLMGSDSCSITPNPPPQVGTNFSISIAPHSKEECDDLFTKLSVDGRVGMPMQETFWGAYFGTVTDQFGINWMINFTLPTA